MERARRPAVLLALPGLVAWWLVGLWAATAAVQPRPSEVGPRERIAGRPVEAVETRTADGLVVRGWLVPAEGDGATRCVVLAHGLGGDRRTMVGRAGWWLARGWSALLVDLRAAGASEGERVSMGWHEARDLEAWHRWLGERGVERVAVHGQSLGAAAALFADVPWDRVALEACYADLDGALAGRLPWVPLPRVSFWPLRVCGSWLVGAPWEAIRPVEAIEGVAAPTLLVCGDGDGAVGAGATEELLAAAAASWKRVALVPGAGHVDLWSFDAGRIGEALARLLAAPR